MTDQVDAQKVGQAAREFVGLAINKLSNEKGVHAETAIAAVARMAGTFLFRSFGFQLPDAKPGQAVLSEQANEQGPRLVNIAATVLSDSGIKLDPSAVSNDSMTGHEPLLSFLDSQKLLEPEFNAVREKLGLSLTQAADAGALAAAMLIDQTAKVLDSNVAFELAVFSFIEGSKTLPAEV
jgi:hypothetical protein